MEITEFRVKPREERGTSAAKRLRANGKVPAVLYGEKIKTIPLMVDERKFAKLVSSEAGTNVVLQLKIEGESKSQTAIIKEIQRNPVKDTFLHIDFQKIAMHEAIEAQVPITVVGESPGVKEGGVLQHGLREIQIKALPKNLPDHFEVSVEGVSIGDSIKVADLPKMEGVEILSDEEETVLSVVPPTELKEEELIVEEEVAEPELVGEEEEAKLEEEEVAEEKEAKEEKKEAAEKEEKEKKEEAKEEKKEK